MPGTSDVRAGRAFVEAYLDKTKLTRGLKSVSADFNAFGAGVSSLGRKFMILGTSITAPLLAATKKFMTFGDSLDKMSQRVGASVEFLSALSHAAQLGGTDIGAMEVGIRRLQRTAYDATRGLSTAKDAFADLGVSVVDANGNIKSTETLFMESAGALSKMENNTKKAALATVVFGRAGTQLLPMLRDGVGGLNAAMQEAADLGLVMSTQQAKDAAALTDAWLRVTSTFKMLVVTIGTALAPAMTGLSGKIKNYIGAAREWIGEHKGLVVTIFSLGVTAVATGLGLFALGKAITLVGSALGAALTVGKAAQATFGFLKASVLLLANPFILVGAAAAALGGYLLYSSGVAGKVATWISQTFATILAEVTDTFGVIADSMAAGDLVSAAKVGWALIKLEWTKGTAFLSGLWESFKQLYDEIVSGLAIGMINASAWIQSIWADLLNWMGKLWQKWATSTFQEGLADFIAPVMAKILGVDTEELRKTMHEDFARKRAGQDDKFAAMDAETAAKKAQIEADRKAQVESIGGDLARRGEERAASKKAAQNAVDAARAEWEAAKKDARVKAAAKGSVFDFSGSIKGFDAPALATAAGMKSSVRGTFSASAVTGLGMGFSERIAKGIEKTFRYTGENTTILKDVRNELQELNDKGMAN